MRVIAGEAKGRRLKGPAGPWTRPMADKIKEALFSALGSLGVEPDTVLDLYAGTGSVGIEALSRGALSADFVDQHAASCAVIRDNLVLTSYDKVSRVHQMGVGIFIARGREPYDLIIIDPPYADPEIESILDRVSTSRLVQSGTIIALGHSPRVKLPERTPRLDQLRLRCHGDSCFSIYEVVEPAEEVAEVG
jgi:16S rRNA (guanine966-N2)-methyltransferase